MGPLAERARLIEAKISRRRAAARANAISRVRALPRIPRVILNSNYVNPITLNFPKGSLMVYELKNKKTGRVDYYDKSTFWHLMAMPANNYKLLMMNPKEPIPGVRNPMTRNPIYPRNVRRVTVAVKKKTPSPNAAAKKIQSAVRKMISKKRVAANSKPKTASPNKRKTPSPNNVRRKTPSTSKSKSKSKSRSK